jgi:hypothetical protein
MSKMIFRNVLKIYNKRNCSVQYSFQKIPSGRSQWKYSTPLDDNSRAKSWLPAKLSYRLPFSISGTITYFPILVWECDSWPPLASNACQPFPILDNFLTSTRLLSRTTDCWFLLLVFIDMIVSNRLVLSPF